MEELDLLKRALNTKTEYLTKDSDKIEQIIRRKSSSFIKQIFIISIIEFLFWFILQVLHSIFGKEDYFDHSFQKWTIVFEILNYVILIIFIIQFYKNYRKISLIDNTSKFMKNIIKTRNTVKLYVIYNISIAALFYIFSIVYLFHFGVDSTILVNIESLNSYRLILIYLILFSVLAVMLFVLWILYKLIYGNILKKLEINYNELNTNRVSD